MTTYTNLSLRAATVLAGGVAAFGGLFMATPALAYYNYAPGGAGLGGVCTSRFDPFCISKETNYVNSYPYSQYSPYSYGNYGYNAPTYGYNTPSNYGGYPSYGQNNYNMPGYGYNTSTSYSSSYQYQYQYCYGSGCAQPMNYNYSYQPMNYGYNNNYSPYGY